MEEKRLLYMAQGRAGTWVSARERQLRREENAARKADLHALLMFLGGVICGMAAYHCMFILGVM